MLRELLMHFLLWTALQFHDTMICWCICLACLVLWFMITQPVLQSANSPSCTNIHYVFLHQLQALTLKDISNPLCMCCKCIHKSSAHTWGPTLKLQQIMVLKYLQRLVSHLLQWGGREDINDEALSAFGFIPSWVVSFVFPAIVCPPMIPWVDESG